MKDQLSKEEMWAELEKRNVSLAQVHFHGGGDEGGVEDVILYNKENEILERLHESYIPQTYDKELNCYVYTREHTVDEKLVNALSQPVYDRYGTFAGEYYVNGQIIYDVKNRDVKMNGEESHEVYESFEEPLEG